MSDPYRTLGVARNADDATIHGAYLELVRRYAPDRHPERFERVRAAYEAIRDRHSRIGHELFSTDPPTLEDLLAVVIMPGPKPRPSEEQLRRAIADGLLEQPPGTRR